jgi:hypothetical protein
MIGVYFGASTHSDYWSSAYNTRAQQPVDMFGVITHSIMLSVFDMFFLSYRVTRATKMFRNPTASALFHFMSRMFVSAIGTRY